jgi:hypothetical protein
MKLRNLLIYLLACAFFLALPFFMGPEGPESIGRSLHNTHLLRDELNFFLLLLFYLLNYNLFVPKLYIKKKYIYYVLLIVISFLIIEILPQLVFPFNEFMSGPPPGPKPFFPFFDISHNLFLFLAVLFFSLMLRISNLWKQTEREKLNTELSYLKTQINPHFLFNTLNSIYSLALEKSDYTATAVVKLSGLMRYITTESSNDFVALEKEINYISDYFELQRFRFGSSVNMSFTVSGETEGKRIAPLLLIPFVENAFKHGVNPEENTMIDIQIIISIDILLMTIKNNKVNLLLDPQQRSGLGVGNTAQRLELIYPGKHSLKIQDENNEFIVELMIEFQ